MYCRNQLLHTIRQDDTIYLLAKRYQTTVRSILALNPNVNPYNLQIGRQLLICPGEDYVCPPPPPVPPIGIIPPVPPIPPVGVIPPVSPGAPVPPIGTVPPVMPPVGVIPGCPEAAARIDLINKMRKAWAQHVYWTRMLLISIAEKLQDRTDVTTRLLQNPGDIAGIFAMYYPSEVTKKIERLLTEHLQIGAELITALRDGKTEESDKLNKEWYANADKMAQAFGSINPYYNAEDLRKMLYKHLDLTKEEVAARIAGNYLSDIAAFDKVEKEALEMADYFSGGLAAVKK